MLSCLATQNLAGSITVLNGHTDSGRRQLMFAKYMRYKRMKLRTAKQRFALTLRGYMPEIYFAKTLA